VDRLTFQEGLEFVPTDSVQREQQHAGPGAVWAQGLAELPLGALRHEFEGFFYGNTSLRQQKNDSTEDRDRSSSD
jgi:hypothetical protein